MTEQNETVLSVSDVDIGQKPFARGETLLFNTTVQSECFCSSSKSKGVSENSL